MDMIRERMMSRDFAKRTHEALALNTCATSNSVRVAEHRAYSYRKRRAELARFIAGDDFYLGRASKLIKCLHVRAVHRIIRAPRSRVRCVHSCHVHTRWLRSMGHS